MKTKLHHLVRLGLLGLLPALLLAQSKKPFEAVATTTGIVPITITASSSQLDEFISNLLNTKGQFAALNGSPYTAKSSFLGVANAITFDTNSTGTAVTLGLAPIGFTKTFTGADKKSVDDQVSDFFEKNGADTIAAFLKAIAKQSPIAVTDGNPNSVTALSAGGLFTGQGFTGAEEFAVTFDELDGGAGEKARFGGLGIGFNAGKFEAGGFKGNNYDFSLSGLNIGFGDNVRLLTPISLNYLDVEGAKVAGGGLNLALPIRLRTMSKDNPFNWRVTPLAGLGFRGSVDLASGALIWQAGAANTIDYKVAPKLVICVINQFTLHRSIKVEYDSYSFDPKIDQQILKNGLRFVTPFTKRLIGDFYVVDTRFLKDAAVKSFETFGASLSLRATKSFNLSIGANYDTGDQFKAYSVGLSSAWRW